MSDKDDTGHYEGALLEEVRDELKAIHEGIAPLSSLPGDVAQLKDDMTEVKADIKTIKLAVKDQSKDHKTLVKRMAEHWNRRPNDNGG